MRLLSFLFCFFQAEDGIRDYKVTGVQTCALPIFFEVLPCFVERCGLRVRAWQFLDKGDVTLGYLAENGRKFHSFPYTPKLSLAVSASPSRTRRTKTRSTRFPRARLKVCGVLPNSSSSRRVKIRVHDVPRKS